MTATTPGTDTLDLARLEELDRAATRAPWDVRAEDLRGGRFHCIAGMDIELHENDNGEHDAALIAAMRNALPALIAAARELAVKDARIAELVEALRPFGALWSKWEPWGEAASYDVCTGRRWDKTRRTIISDLKGADLRRAARLIHPAADGQEKAETDGEVAS